MSLPEVPVCTSARYLFEALGKDAAKAAFFMALDRAAEGDEAGETRWLAIAIEVMSLHRQRSETIAELARLTEGGTTAIWRH